MDSAARFLRYLAILNGFTIGLAFLAGLLVTSFNFTAIAVVGLSNVLFLVGCGAEALPRQWFPEKKKTGYKRYFYAALLLVPVWYGVAFISFAISG